MKRTLLIGSLLLLLIGLLGWYTPRLLIAGICILLITPLLAMLIPIRVHASGSCKGSDCHAHFQGSWLFSMIKFRFDWDSGSDGKPSLRLLGWEILEED